MSDEKKINFPYTTMSVGDDMVTVARPEDAKRYEDEVKARKEQQALEERERLIEDDDQPRKKKRRRPPEED